MNPHRLRNADTRETQEDALRSGKSEGAVNQPYLGVFLMLDSSSPACGFFCKCIPAIEMRQSSSNPGSFLTPLGNFVGGDTCPSATAVISRYKDRQRLPLTRSSYRRLRLETVLSDPPLPSSTGTTGMPFLRRTRLGFYALNMLSVRVGDSVPVQVLGHLNST